MGGTVAVGVRGSVARVLGIKTMLDSPGINHPVIVHIRNLLESKGEDRFQLTDGCHRVMLVVKD